MSEPGGMGPARGSRVTTARLAYRCSCGGGRASLFGPFLCKSPASCSAPGSAYGVAREQCA